MTIPGGGVGLPRAVPCNIYHSECVFHPSFTFSELRANCLAPARASGPCHIRCAESFKARAMSRGGALGIEGTSGKQRCNTNLKAPHYVINSIYIIYYIFSYIYAYINTLRSHIYITIYLDVFSSEDRHSVMNLGTLL